jgi:glycosyltransferase involved in cell wall biosynthesis
MGRTSVLKHLNGCDFVILNEEGPALAGHLRVPHGVLLTGSDIEIFANPYLAESLKSSAFANPRWASRLSRWFLPTSLIQRRLVRPQREGIKSARFVAFLPIGLVPTADRLLEEIGVMLSQRIQLQFTDCEFSPYSQPANNSVLRVFSATRLTWLPEPDLTPLDLKGSDVMLRGLAAFSRMTNSRLDIHLVKKGRHVAEAINLANELGLTDQITWHMEMSQLEIQEQFRRADIVLEQFGSSAVGMAGFDAMATGRPLIANGRPEIFTALVGEISPICQATTAEEICTQLKYLADSLETRIEVGLASRTYVEKHFSTDSAAARLTAKIAQE